MDRAEAPRGTASHVWEPRELPEQTKHRTQCCAEHREPNSIGLRFLQQAVLQGTVALHHVSTTDQLAGLFTKPLDPVHPFRGPNDGKYQRILTGYRIRGIAGECFMV